MPIAGYSDKQLQPINYPSHATHKPKHWNYHRQSSKIHYWSAASDVMSISMDKNLQLLHCLYIVLLAHLEWQALLN